MTRRSQQQQQSPAVLVSLLILVLSLTSSSSLLSPGGTKTHYFCHGFATTTTATKKTRTAVLSSSSSSALLLLRRTRRMTTTTTTTTTTRTRTSTAAVVRKTGKTRPGMTTTALCAIPSLASVAADLTGGAAATAAAANGVTTSSAGNPVWTFFLETCIANGVPALFTIAVIAFAARTVVRMMKRGDGGAGGGGMMSVFDDDGGFGPDPVSDALTSDTAAAQLYNDLYGDQDQSSGAGGGRGGGNGGGGGGGDFLKRLLGGGKKGAPLPRNVGVPATEYIRMTNVNDKLNSYRYSVRAATQSKAAAAAEYREIGFERAWSKALLQGDGVGNNNNDDTSGATEEQPPPTPPPSTPLSPAVLQLLENAERDFLKQGDRLVRQLQSLQVQIAAAAVDAELADMGMKSVYQLDPPAAPAAAAPESVAEGTPDAAAAAADTAADSSNSSSHNATTAAAAASADEKTKKKGSSSSSSTSSSSSGMAGKTTVLQSKVAATQRELQQLELEFIKRVVRAVGPGRAAAVRAAVLGDVASRGLGGLLVSLRERPLKSLLLPAESKNSSSDDNDNEPTTATNAAGRRPILYVCRFTGDVTASQVGTLREEVTAIQQRAAAGYDQVLVVLQTGGGTVTGYGLGAAQLQRIKSAGLRLVIAVEQVAASGGYMMSCVADEIVASPFAVLGSIGVVSEIPNVYERLKREGVEFQSVTAGKYKRTLTPTKKVTAADYEKTKADLQDVFVLFRDFVKQNRPKLDIDAVATGETWLGTAALERNLCDDLKTVDEVLLDYVAAGYDVFEVEYAPPPRELSRLLPLSSSSVSAVQQQQQQGVGLLSSFDVNDDNAPVSWIRAGIRWLVRSLADEIRHEMIRSTTSSVIATEDELNVVPRASPNAKDRYMAFDDRSDRIRTQD